MKKLLAAAALIALANPAAGAGPNHKQNVAILYHTGHLRQSTGNGQTPTHQTKSVKLPDGTIVFTPWQQSGPIGATFHNGESKAAPLPSNPLPPIRNLPPLPRKGFDGAAINGNLDLINRILLQKGR